MPIYTGDKFGFGKAPDTGGDGADPGEAFFPEPGQYDWVCPAGVTKVCAVCIGGGGGATRDEMGGAGGGGLGYKNDIPVTPGETYKIQVGAGGVSDTYMGNYGASGGDSWFINATTVKGGGGGGTGCGADGDHTVPGYGGRGGTYVGDGGGNGGNGGDGNRSSINGTGADTGGGGAGGYGGDGGLGGDYNGNWQSGSAGNGGAGGGGCTAAGGSNEYWGGGGGGVSVYGQGRNGGDGSNHQYDWQSGGIGGSGGAAGWGNGGNASGYGHVSGGQFGGGGGSTDARGGGGGSGAVRIIWGTGRAFPKTGCDDYWSETITRYTAPTAEDTTATSSNWFRGGLGEEDNSNYASNHNYNGIVPNIQGHSTLDGDLTIECWIYVERLSDNTQQFGSGSNGWGAVIMDGRPLQSSTSGQLGSWWVSRGNDRRGSTGPYFINYNIEGGNNIQSDTECIHQCTWHHVALTRQDNYWWLWVDGVRVYTGTSSEGPGYNTALQAQNDRPVIGGWGYGGRMHFWSFFGNISNFRISKGVALYDSTGTTYTVPTFPLTTTLPGQSGYFKVTQDNNSGHGSYIDLGADLITPNYQTYTVEVWCRPLQTPSGEIWVVDQHPSGNGRTIIGARGGNLGWFSGSWFQSSTSFGNTTDWAHLAFVANNGNIEVFKNGISAGSQSGHITAAPPSQNTLWGQDTSYGQSGCEYRGFRFNTNALYTSNFTPPSIDGGLTNISGTVALWDGLTGSAHDASGNNTWSATNMTFSAVGGSGATVEVLCCGVQDDYEKDSTGSRVWSGPNCMPSVLGPGAPTSESMKKGYRIWGRHRGLGGGTKTGNNGDPGDGGLLSTWKKSTGSFQTEQFGTHGGWSAGTNTADGVAIKVLPNGAYATGNNAGAKWNLKTISYGVPTYRPRNNSLGMGPFIPNVQIRVVLGKDMDGTIVYDSQQFTLRLPSYNHWDSNGGTPSKERYTSCAFEIELPNGGANDLDMDTWYSIFLKGMEHPNNNNWNSTNGTPGSNKQNFWYPESPVSYSNNSGSFNLMRYAPSTSGDGDEVEVRLEQCTYGGSWATPTHGNFQPLGQYPFFGISMPINFMKDPLPVPGAAPAMEKVFHASCWNTQETYTWTVPAGVTSICVICVGGGGAGETQHDGASGGGGGLAYKNDITVTPGETVTVRVGAGGFATSNGVTDAPDGLDSYIEVGGTQYAVAGGGRGADGNMGNEWLDNSQSFPNTNSDGGGHGGCGVHHSGCRQSGGGAGGYNGGGQTTSGYAAGNYSVSNTNAAGSGGGGGGGYSQNGSSNYYSAGGGGTGIYGQGSNGAAGDNTGSPSDWKSFCGKGGSTAHNTGLSGYSVSSPQTTYWGTPTGASCPAGQTQYLREQYLANYHGSNHATPDGGFPGGGGGGSNSGSAAGWGGNGVVRIIWGTANGITRAFPSTGVDRSDQYAGGSVETSAGTQRQY